MSGKLVILCTSEKPDPYFNAVAYSVLALGIKDFLLVMIGDEVEPDLIQRGDRLLDNLSALVRDLGAGAYTPIVPGSKALESPQAVSDPAAVNTFLDRLGWGALTIGRRSVTESGLADLLKAESKAQSAFDVTACKNSAVAGAVAWLVSRGGSPIYSFESKKRPTYGAEDLLPLLANDEYVYRDLSQSPLVKAASSRVNFWTLKRKQFLLWSAAAAVVFALLTTTLSQSVAFSVLSGVASFASIVSIFAIFVREDL